MAVVVVDKGQLGVIELAAPLDGLGGATCGGDGAIGRVCVSGGDVAGGAKDFAHVLGEVDAIGVPSAAFLGGKRAGGYGLRRIPDYEPKSRVMATGEVNAGDL